MSWNIKTPGDYINGPLTVAGVTQFNSNVGVGIAPAVNLHVASSGNTQFRIESTGTTAGATNRLQFKNASGALDVRSGVIEWYDVNTFKGDFRLLKNGGIEIRNSSDSATFNLSDLGNVGLSVTPATWSAYRAIGINNQGFNLYSNILASIGGIVSNGYYNGTNWIYLNSASSGRYEISGNSHAFYAAPSGTATNPISGANAFVNVFNINANGAAALAGGNVSANGVGLTFPSAQSASTDANTLDDYEEGTWTGTLKGSVSDPTVAVTSTGRYTKIGRVVTVHIVFDNVNTTGASGDVTISGLPFIGALSVAGSTLTFGGFTSATNLSCYNASTSIYYFNSGNYSPATHSAGTGKYIWATITYTV